MFTELSYKFWGNRRFFSFLFSMLAQTYLVSIFLHDVHDFAILHCAVRLHKSEE